MHIYAPGSKVTNRIKNGTMRTRVCPTCQGAGKVQLADRSYQFCTPCLGSGVLYLTTETYNRLHAHQPVHRSQEPTPTHTHRPPGRER